MKQARLLVEELGREAGTTFEFSEDGHLELELDGEIMYAHYFAEERSWIIAGVVHIPDDGGEIGPDVMARALEANLHGVRTHGLHLGLSFGSLIVSGRYDIDGMTAVDLAKDFMFVSSQIKPLRRFVLDENGVDEPAADERAAESAAPTGMDVFRMLV